MNLSLNLLVRNLFCSLFLWSAAAAYGQTALCDTIYDHPETPAVFTPGNSVMLQFINDSIIPVIAMQSDSLPELPGKLYIVLTIDHDGNVTDAQFPRSDLPETCKTVMRNRYCSMKGWSPAQSNGKPVCSTQPAPISCLHWR